MSLGSYKAFDPKNLSKKDRLIINLVFGIPVIPIFLFGIYAVFFEKGPSKDDFRKRDKAEVFAGKVIELYFDEKNHNVKKAILSNGYEYYISWRWEGEIEIGDSLSKKLNSLQLEIYKPNCKRVSLNYEACY